MPIEILYEFENLLTSNDVDGNVHYPSPEKFLYENLNNSDSNNNLLTNKSQATFTENSIKINIPHKAENYLYQIPNYIKLLLTTHCNFDTKI